MPVYCKEVSGFDSQSNRLYLQDDSFIALLIITDQMSSDLQEASAVIRLLLYEEYSILHQCISIRLLTFSIFFCFLLAQGYTGALADYWIDESDENPIRIFCGYDRLIRIRDELYGVQLGFCKVLYKDVKTSFTQC